MTGVQTCALPIYPAGVVTASIGVAEYRSETKDEDVLVAADRALYRAKAAGRNRVGVATGSEPEEQVT